MEEKKLTDEELLEALRICTELEDDCDRHCPLFGDLGCMNQLCKHAFDYIQRLQDENKALKTDLENEIEEHKQFVKLAKQIDEEQKAEIERLTEELDFYKGANRGLESMNEQLIAETRKLLEEKEELQEQVDELKEERYYTEQDTAKEIFAEIGKLCDQLFNGKILTQEFMAKYAELMKRKGVEVE